MLKEKRHVNPGDHNIVSWFYYQDQLVMEIEFKSGKVYRYFHVEQWRGQEFAVTASMGRYFGLHIRNNKIYPFLPLQPGDDAVDPQADDFERAIQKADDQIKDRKQFDRERDLDRAGVMEEVNRTKGWRPL